MIDFMMGKIENHKEQILMVPCNRSQRQKATISDLSVEYPYIKYDKTKTFMLCGKKEKKRLILLFNTYACDDLFKILSKISSKIKNIKSVVIPFICIEDKTDLKVYEKWSNDYNINITIVVEPFGRSISQRILDYLISSNPDVWPLVISSPASKGVDKTYEDISLEEYSKIFTPKGWRIFFRQIIPSGCLSSISEIINNDIKKKIEVYPPLHDVYAVFNLCRPEDIKVVIIGQDPYHTPGAAMGIAFGHRNTRSKIQPSLKNIYKELQDDLGIKIDTTKGDLSRWVEQGVFLINTALTVQENKAYSHAKEWKKFTKTLFEYLNDHHPMVIVIWGTPAAKLATIFDDKHHKIKSSHPSPLSAHISFFGSKPFSQINEKLEALGKTPIDWTI
jgi:uracil-DNA glycosylase